MRRNEKWQKEWLSTWTDCFPMLKDVQKDAKYDHRQSCTTLPVLCFMLDSCHFLLLLLELAPAIPARPAPNKSMVEGSGTGLASKVLT